MRRVSYLVLLVLSIALCSILSSYNECQGNRRFIEIPAKIEFISCSGITYAYIVHYEGKKYMMNTNGGILEIK
jgi:hypothetical protein